MDICLDFIYDSLKMFILEKLKLNHEESNCIETEKRTMRMRSKCFEISHYT